MPKLSPLRDEYRLDHRLKADIDSRTGKPRAGFETHSQCVAEDGIRARALRATARAIIGGALPELRRLGSIDPRTALNLANRLEAGANTGEPPATTASSLFLREYRINFISPLLELIDHYRDLPIGTFTLIHPSWSYRATRLMGIDARQITNQFRTQLNRARVTSAPGFLLAHIHGEFEPISKNFQLHFHGVAAGDKLKALNNLRNQQGYVRTEKIFRPIVVNKLNCEDRARQLSYIAQPFWPAKARVQLNDGTYTRVRTKRRIDEPYHSLYLLWLDKWKMSELRLLNGIRLQNGKLITTS